MRAENGGCIPRQLPPRHRETSGQQLEEILHSFGGPEYAHGHAHHGVKYVDDHGMLHSATQSFPNSFVPLEQHFMVAVEQDGCVQNGVFVPGHSAGFAMVPLGGSDGPLGVITSPMDTRVAGNPASPQHFPTGEMHINGVVVRGDPSEVTVQIGRSREVEMSPVLGAHGLLQSPPFDANSLPDGVYQVSMRTREGGMRSTHCILMAVGNRWDLPVRRDATSAAGVLDAALGTTWGGIGPNDGGYFRSDGTYVETFGPPFESHQAREAAERALFS